MHSSDYSSTRSFLAALRSSSKDFARHSHSSWYFDFISVQMPWRLHSQTPFSGLSLFALFRAFALLLFALHLSECGIEVGLNTPVKKIRLFVTQCPIALRAVP